MKRRMITVFVDADHAKDVENIFELCELTGYSMIPTVYGKGEAGRKLGNRAFPGSSNCYIAAVTETCARDLADRLRKLRDTCGPDEGIKVFATDVEELV